MQSQTRSGTGGSTSSTSRWLAIQAVIGRLAPGGMNLVGAGITAATKTWLPEFFDRAIARPLQFGRYYFNVMPTFEGYTGGGMWMRPRDLLKFGQTYLDGGMWSIAAMTHQGAVPRNAR